MSASRTYFGDRSRDRPNFNNNRRDRPFIGNIPASRHCIFIRGFPSTVSAKHVRNFFADETRSAVEIDFVSYTDDHKKLCVAIRFESNQIARDIFSKYNNREILGHKVEFSWFKDMKAVKGKCEGLDNDRPFRGSYYNNNNNNRQPRRFNDRRSRSKPRNRDSKEKRRNKSHSRSKDSGSSSSYSKSRSGSDSLSDRSSGSPTRLIRNINKDKYKRRRTSGDSSSYKEHSKERNETKSDEENIDKKKIKSGSRKGSEEKSTFNKTYTNLEIKEQCDSYVAQELTKKSTVTDSEVSKVKLKSTELLEEYSKDAKKYLNVVNVLIEKHVEYEAPLVDTLKDILTDLGDKYLQKLLSFVEKNSANVTAFVQ